MEKKIREYCLLLYLFYHEDQDQLSIRLDEWLASKGYKKLTNKEIWQVSNEDFSSKQQHYQKLTNELPPDITRPLDQILKDLGINKNKSVKNSTASFGLSSSYSKLPKKAPRTFKPNNQESSHPIQNSAQPTAVSTFYRQKVEPIIKKSEKIIQKTEKQIKTYQFKPIHIPFYGIVILFIVGLIVLKYYTSPYYKAKVQLTLLTGTIKSKKLLGIRSEIQNFKSNYTSQLNRRDRLKLMTELTNQLNKYPNTYYALHFMENQDVTNYPLFFKYYNIFLEQFPNTNTPTHIHYKKRNEILKKNYEQWKYIQEEKTWYEKLKNIKNATIMRFKLELFKKKFPNSQYLGILEQKLKDLEYNAVEELQNETK